MAAVILDVVFSLGKGVVKSKSWLYLSVMAAAFVATFFFDVNVVYVILAAAVIGIASAVWEHRKEGETK